MSTAKNPDIVLYDNTCRFCRLAAFGVKCHDLQTRFDLVPLDSPKGQELRQSVDDRYADVDSIIVLADRQIRMKSEAVMHIAKELPTLRLMYYLLKIVPRPFRDRMYDFFASCRHTIDRRPARRIT